MTKYIIIDKSTNKPLEFLKPFEDVISARCWINAHQKYYDKGLYWTIKEEDKNE